jgi:hypothetical protein
VHNCGVASPERLAPSPEPVTVNRMNESGGEGVFLTPHEVMDLLRLRSRATLLNMRRRGELVGHELPNGRWLYAADQPVIAAARKALTR